MERNGGARIALTIDFHGGLYISIIKTRYGGTQNASTVALHGGLYLAIIMDLMEGPTIPLQHPGMEDST
jgi:hypothetical protein